MEQQQKPTQPTEDQTPETPSQDAPPATDSGKDKYVKAGFLLVIVLVMAGIYFSRQRADFTIRGWGTDLDAALSEAKQNNRKTVAMFVNDPPGVDAQWMRDNVIIKPINKQALSQGGFVPVVVTLADGTDNAIAKKYEITQLPTLIVFRSDGTERNREVGRVGEVPFTQNLLQYDPDE